MCIAMNKIVDVCNPFGSDCNFLYCDFYKWAQSLVYSLFCDLMIKAFCTIRGVTTGLTSQSSVWTHSALLQRNSPWTKSLPFLVYILKLMKCNFRPRRTPLFVYNFKTCSALQCLMFCVKRRASWCSLYRWAIHFGASVICDVHEQPNPFVTKSEVRFADVTQQILKSCSWFLYIFSQLHKMYCSLASADMHLTSTFTLAL
jgi:hypothetical protein